MTAPIELFSVHIRISVCSPPVDLLCQAVDLDGEKALWVDGITMDMPVLIPIASIAECIEYRGTFRDFVLKNLNEANAVFSVCDEGYSPLIMARVIQRMTLDRTMSAKDALHYVFDQALDVLDSDRTDAEVFYKAQAEVALQASA